MFLVAKEITVMNSVRSGTFSGFLLGGGQVEGRTIQPIALIRPGGGISRVPQLAQSVLFAVGFD